MIDDTESSLTRQPAHSPPASRSRLRDVIDDFDDAEVIRDGPAASSYGNELLGDVNDSTPPEESQSPGVLDAEFDALFAPTRDGNKRRRMDKDTPSTSTRPIQLDSLSSSPPQMAKPLAIPIDSPDMRRHSMAIWEPGIRRTPAPSARQDVPPPSTPGDMKTPFRGRPRFMLSSAMKPPSSQSAPRFKPSTPTISPPENRKPAFVLPRSPSPNPNAEETPAPFSPSSRTLGRRGRNRGGISNYTPGGMAAQVRSWALEMGAKREQLPMPSLLQSLDPQAGLPSSEALRYFLAARVISITDSRLGACGSLVFLQAEPVAGHQQDQNFGESMNILIMGSPKAQPDTCQTSSNPDTLKVIPVPGDLIGIHRGLNWNFHLGTLPCQLQTQSHIANSTPDLAPLDNDRAGQAKEKWLVAMEWDLIHSHADS